MSDTRREEVALLNQSIDLHETQFKNDIELLKRSLLLFGKSSYSNYSVDKTRESFLNESSDFQWCTDGELQRSLLTSSNTPRSIFEGSLLNVHQQEQQKIRRHSVVNIDEKKYEVISKNIDANLAEIDIENFKSEDINSMLSYPEMPSTIQQEGGEEFASVSDSLIRELEMNSQSRLDAVFDDKESLIIDEDGKQQTSFSYENEDNSNDYNDEDLNGKVNFSVDSLDLSSLENTNKMVLRCTETDKTKYTIAFEETSMSTVSAFTDSNEYDDNGQKDSNSSFQTEEQYQEQQQTQSVQKLTTRQVSPIDRHVKSKRKEANKTQPFLQSENGQIPLYDLSNSQYNSSGEEFCTYSNNNSNSSNNNSPSLFKLFMRNHISPLSSEQGSSSNSFESHSQDSAASGGNGDGNLSTSTLQNNFLPNYIQLENISKNNYGNFTFNHNGYSNNNSNNNFTTVNNNLYYQRLNETNNNDEITEAFEDSLTESENRSMFVTAPLLTPSSKLQFRIKPTSPIKEEDEQQLTDSSRADVVMQSGDESRNYEDDENVYGVEQAQSNFSHIETVHQCTQVTAVNKHTFSAHRSSSMDRFMNVQSSNNNNITRPTFTDFTQINNNNTNNVGTFVCNGNRPFRSANVSKEFSPFSSGYLSSRQNSSEWYKRGKSSSQVSLTKMKTVSTQIPVHIQDKQIQTSLGPSKSLEFVLRDEDDEDADNINNNNETNETNPKKKSLYVCYPNYSLPDLSFLNEAGARSPTTAATTKMQTPHTPPQCTKVILSPTKFKQKFTGNINRVPVSRGCRPKSCTDYENLSKDTFNHIKDWDSLKVLLPNEFKCLIDKLNDIRETNDEAEEKVNSQENISTIKFRSPQHQRYPMRQQPHQPPHRRSIPTLINKNQCSCDTTNVKNKRFSLQEPFAGEMPTISTPMTPPTRRTMSKSATMPCHCVYQMHHYQHCYKNCYHYPYHNDCFTTPVHFIPQYSHAEQPLSATASIINADELSEKISMRMTLKEVANIINHVRNENSVNDDYDQCLNECKKLCEDSASFKELKKHWEAISMSPSKPIKHAKSISKKDIPNNASKNKDDDQSKLNNSNIKSKPLVPAKPLQVIKTTAVKNKKDLINERAGIAARPTTLNTTITTPAATNVPFKSMIPIAKGTKSPPGSKKTSPNQ